MRIPSLKLVGHMLMEQPVLPPIPWPRGYVIAQNGVFAWARREGLEALIPVAPCAISGLYPIEPYVHLTYPPVDVWLVSEMLRLAYEARTPDGDLLEILFYLTWDTRRGWQLTVPLQDQQAMRVSPVVEALDPSLYANTLMEIHSHNKMSAFFSRTDTADEQGFRLYGVVGRSSATSQRFRMRIGIYGHFWEIPASMVLSLPWGITDCVVRDRLRDAGPQHNIERMEDASYGA